ncbi:MAG: hypothetical protein JXA30_20395 [Deltaproteobacteria bacterium]|nr:hypothetical protein [Deltaproteobacteria bacterium]
MIAAIWPVSSAAAYENQITLGGDLGFAERFADEGPRHGGTLGLLSSIGLDDIWSARARFSYSIHHSAGLLHVFLVSTEILYLIDILEFVPYLGVGPDGVATLYEDELQLDAAIHAVFGVDYLFSRELIFGLEARPMYFLSRTGLHTARLAAVFTVSYSFEM